MSVTSGNCSRIITYVRFMYFLKITFIFNILMHNCKSLCDQNAWKASLHISCMPPVYLCVCVRKTILPYAFTTNNNNVEKCNLHFSYFTWL